MDKQPPSDDRRVPSNWEEVVGKNIETDGDRAQIQEALDAMRRNGGEASAPSPVDKARVELQAARERAQSGDIKPSPPSSPIAKRYRDAGSHGIAEARDRLVNGPRPGDEDPGPPTLPDPRIK